MNKGLGLELPEVPKPVTKHVPTSSSWISRGEVIVEGIPYMVRSLVNP